ncbi:MAG: RpiB/LacA/LacB family sugar-phosphate isomerase [Patescibacteria group bacterium]
MNKTIYLASDHAGFHLKESLREQLEQKGFIVEDMGARTLDPLDDYPQYASAVARAVQKNPQSFGILSCGNAEGVCITANKFDGIRAGVGFSIKSAQTMREDDNANIVCIPGRIETLDDPIKIANTFLSTPFSNDIRHLRRISQIDKLENTYPKVLPTILVQNPKTFTSQISNSRVRALSTMWQIDVLDETMFESNSWFDPQVISKIENLPELELHLMILDPLPIIELAKFHLPTLRRVIIHAEIDKPLESIVDYSHNLGLQVGVALNPETKIKSIKSLADKIDLLLIMGVHPGASNQEFLGRKILKKITKARKLYPHLIIEVDGGVNQKTIKTISKAGAQQMCVNSAIWQSNNPAIALETLSPNAL